MRRLMILAFTDKGNELGTDISNNLCAGELDEIRVKRVVTGTLYETTYNAWKDGYDLLFIGAVGIAVRAIAGLTDSKLKDRAVLVMDEKGRYVIPILSGHVGGAGSLARLIAGYTGGEVISTSASDVREVPAFDEWASKNCFVILDRSGIAPVYDRIFEDKAIRVICIEYEGEIPFEKYDRISDADIPLTDVCPEDAPDVIIYGGTDINVINMLTDKYTDRTLIMASRYLTVGIGCKRGTSPDMLMDCIEDACSRGGLDIRLIGRLATIDLKADEEGIRSICALNRWKLVTYTAKELREAKGEFDPSVFVEKTVGVDNVCERASVRDGGRLIVPKSVYKGVTVAIAKRLPAKEMNV